MSCLMYKIFFKGYEMKQIDKRIELAQYIPVNGIAAELGVGAGNFSKELLETNKNFKSLYSIDRWAGDRNHDDVEFQNTSRLLKETGKHRSIIIRKQFHEAVLDFEDEFFDFIYIDGYAHTGQEDGATLRQWWPLLKDGGIFAGHDYHPQFPENIKAVNQVIKTELKRDFQLTLADRFPSWYLIK